MQGLEDWAIKATFETILSRGARKPTNKKIGSPNSSSLEEAPLDLGTT